MRPIPALLPMPGAINERQKRQFVASSGGAIRLGGVGAGLPGRLLPRAARFLGDLALLEVAVEGSGRPLFTPSYAPGRATTRGPKNSRIAQRRSVLVFPVRRPLRDDADLIARGRS